ncbi:hypothetical protein BHE74_00059050, partial [Ensete ventricosum]
EEAMLPRLLLIYGVRQVRASPDRNRQGRAALDQDMRFSLFFFLFLFLFPSPSPQPGGYRSVVGSDGRNRPLSTCFRR